MFTCTRYGMGKKGPRKYLVVVWKHHCARDTLCEGSKGALFVSSSAGGIR